MIENRGWGTRDSSMGASAHELKTTGKMPVLL